MTGGTGRLATAWPQQLLPPPAAPLAVPLDVRLPCGGEVPRSALLCSACGTGVALAAAAEGTTNEAHVPACLHCWPERLAAQQAQHGGTAAAGLLPEVAWLRQRRRERGAEPPAGCCSREQHVCACCDMLGGTGNRAVVAACPSLRPIQPLLFLPALAHPTTSPCHALSKRMPAHLTTVWT